VEVGAADRRVADDQRIDPAIDRGAGDVVDLRRVEIGRDLEEQRRRAPRGDAGGDEVAQRRAMLQIAQAGGVGAADIDRDVIRDRRGVGDAVDVIGDAVGGVLVRADIDAENAVALGCARARQRGGQAAIIEPHPVDDRAILDQAKQAGLRVARLGQRGERAHLDTAEAQAEPAGNGAGILVDARREADGVGEVDPGNGGAEARGGFDAAGRCADTAPCAKRGDGRLMRAFGVHAEEEGVIPAHG